MKMSRKRNRRNLLLLISLAIFSILLAMYCNRTTIEEYPSASNDFLQSALKIDRFKRPRADIAREVQEALLNFPISFWEANGNEGLYFRNISCATFPTIYSLKVNNLYWQILSTSNGTFHLFAAYYDVRKRCPHCPAVRILGMIDRVRPTVKTYCQIWFDHRRQPVIVPTASYHPMYLYPDKKRTDQVLHYGYVIRCPIPVELRHEVPMFVSLVERQCDIASNSLRVIYNRPEDGEEKKRFAVCVKASYFQYENLSVKLIEWIELMQLLGAQKIFFYPLHVNENISKVLDYYVKRGTVELSPFTYCGEQPNMAGLQHLYILGNKCRKLVNEIVSLNDCFYKNMYRYEYVVILDVDEAIIPREENDWQDLMTKVVRKALSENDKIPSHYIAKNVLYTSEFDESTKWYKDIPPYMHMLQHVLRNKFTWGNYHKSFFVTGEVISVWNHWTTGSFRRYYGYEISTTDAQLHHYRYKNYHPYNASDVEKDTIIWRYKKPLIKRTLAALYELGFFG